MKGLIVFNRQNSGSRKRWIRTGKSLGHRSVNFGRLVVSVAFTIHRSAFFDLKWWHIEKVGGTYLIQFGPLTLVWW